MLDDLQRLSSTQAALLYRLIDLGYLTQSQVDTLINQLVVDRFTKALDYWYFAQQLDTNIALNQPHIISRCYYAMYHATRALVLHVHRSDMDSHERLPVLLNQILTTRQGDILNRWREVRNQIDYSPYLPADLTAQVLSALNDTNDLVTACQSELRNRGVTL
jgi:uncharacterized protein (UPF0332 family)